MSNKTSDFLLYTVIKGYSATLVDQLLSLYNVQESTSQVTNHVRGRGCKRGGLASEAVPRLALPDGLVESLTKGEVSLALGALHELTALRREQNKFPNAFFVGSVPDLGPAESVINWRGSLLSCRKLGRNSDKTFKWCVSNISLKLLFVKYLNFNMQQPKFEGTCKKYLPISCFFAVIFFPNCEGHTRNMNNNNSSLLGLF
jgi:hypothetical protein